MELTQGMKRLFRELSLRQDFPAVERQSVKRRVNAALNAAPTERRAFIRHRIRMIAVLAAVILALCGTTFAIFRFHFLNVYYEGDTLPLEKYMVYVTDSITNGVFTVRLEGAVTDQFTTIAGLSIQSDHTDALSELMRTDSQSQELPQYMRLFAFRGMDSSPGVISCHYQRLEQYDTENTVYLSVRITGAVGALHISFREAGANASVLEVPLNKQVEALEIYPTLPDLKNWGYQVERITLSLMGLKLEIKFPQIRKSSDPDFILPFYFRMTDGSIQTPPQFFGTGTPWKSISLISENTDGSCTYLYSAPTQRPVDLLSVSSIIIQGMEYSFQSPEQAVPMAVDETITPFLAPFIKIGAFFYVPAQDVCQHIEAALSVAPDEKTATLLYRGVAIEFEIGSTLIIVNVVPCEIDGGNTLLRDGVLLVSNAVWEYLQVGVNMYISDWGNAATLPECWLITP